MTELFSGLRARLASRFVLLTMRDRQVACEAKSRILPPTVRAIYVQTPISTKDSHAAWDIEKLAELRLQRELENA